MRDPKRIPKLLKLIEEVWLTEPDMRFFQMIFWLKNNLPDEKAGISGDYFYTEDDDVACELMKALNVELAGVQGVTWDGHWYVPDKP